MRRVVQLFLFVSVVGIAVSCKKSMDDYPLSNLRAIAAFSIESYHNTSANIFAVHKGEINEAMKTIIISVPLDADLSHLRPTIELSPWSTCQPASLQEVDFSHGDSLDYKVIAQSGKTAIYTVYIKKDYKYTDADIYGVYFTELLDENNEPRNCRFSAQSATIWVPQTTDLTAIKTHIDLSYPSKHATIEVDESGTGSSYRAFVNDEKLNCSSQIILFRVKSQDGKTTKTFTVTVSLIEPIE